MNRISDYTDYLESLSLEGLKLESLTISRTPENKKILTKILSLMANKLKTPSSTKEPIIDPNWESKRYQSVSQDYYLLNNQ